MYVSIDVSRMVKTDVLFVEAGAKADNQYYMTRSLAKACWPTSERDVAVCTLQQDSAPSHAARNTVRYLKRESNVQSVSQKCGYEQPRLHLVDYAMGSHQHRREELSKMC